MREHDLTISDSYTEMSVEKSVISGLKRIFYSDYHTHLDDPNICDSASDSTEASYPSAVFMSAADYLNQNHLLFCTAKSL